jgi:hypothetical protein
MTLNQGAVAACAVVVLAALVAGAGAPLDALVSAWAWASKLLRDSVVLQTLFGTSIAGGAVLVASRIGALASTVAVRLLLTSVSIHPTTQPLLYAAVERLVKRQATTAMGAAMEATILPPAAMTWRERVRCMAKSASAGREEAVVRLVPRMLSHGLPVFARVSGTLVAVSLPADAGRSMCVTVFGARREAAVRSVLQEALDAHVSSTTIADGGTVGSSGAVTYLCVVDTAGQRWVPSKDLRTRTAASLVLPDTLMDRLLLDARTFFASVDEYVKRQQPFRRGWMLYGPPGTGKSTVPVVVASELDVPVCMLDLGSKDMTDARLHAALCAAPTPSIILVQDVDSVTDAALMRRPRATPAADGSTNANAGTKTASGACLSDEEASAGGEALRGGRTRGDGRGRSSVTLAGLLNALDGVGAHEGHLVLMTANDVGLLDPALLRGGRCDLRVQLPLARPAILRRLFCNHFPEATPAQCAQFAALLRPSDVVSPAEVVAKFMEFKTASELLGAPTNVLEELLPGRSQLASAGLFEFLWSSGLEHLFSDFLVNGLIPGGASQFDGPLLAITGFPPRDFQSVAPALVRNLSREAVIEVVLASLLDVPAGVAESAAAAVADAVAAAPLAVTKCRLVKFVGMYADDPELLVASLHVWFLRVDGPRTSASCPPPLSLLRFLWFVGVPEGAETDTLLAALARVRVTTLLTWYRSRSRVAVSDLLDPYMSSGGRYFRPSNTTIDTLGVAAVLAAAYGVSTRCAMDAARAIIGPTGFQFLSRANVCAAANAHDTIHDATAYLVGQLQRWNAHDAALVSQRALQ